MKQIVATLVLALTAGTVLAQGPTSQPLQTATVLADPVGQPSSPTEDEARALRQEVSRLRAEVEAMRAQQAAEPATGQTTLPPSPYAPWRQPAPQPQAQPAPEAVRQSPRVAVLPAFSSVQISDVEVATRGAELNVEADVTLNGLANVPFIFEALLVTPDEQVHTNAQGRPYAATRQIRTGDESDTDDYNVSISLTNLFSSNPPADLYVQVRILDVQGNIVAKSGLHTFRRP